MGWGSRLPWQRAALPSPMPSGTLTSTLRHWPWLSGPSGGGLGDIVLPTTPRLSQRWTEQCGHGEGARSPLDSLAGPQFSGH